MGLIFAWIHFRKVKKIVFHEDLYSRIWSFQNFRKFGLSKSFARIYFREINLDIIKQKISKENKKIVFF